MVNLKPCPLCGRGVQTLGAHAKKEKYKDGITYPLWCRKCDVEFHIFIPNSAESANDFVVNTFKHRAEVPDKDVGEWKKYPEEKPAREEEIQFYWIVDGEILRGYGVLEWEAWDCGDFVLRTTHTGESQSFIVEENEDVIYWQPLSEPPEEGM